MAQKFKYPGKRNALRMTLEDSGRVSFNILPRGENQPAGTRLAIVTLSREEATLLYNRIGGFLGLQGAGAPHVAAGQGQAGPGNAAAPQGPREMPDMGAFRDAINDVVSKIGEARDALDTLSASLEELSDAASDAD